MQKTLKSVLFIQIKEWFYVKKTPLVSLHHVKSYKISKKLTTS